MGFIPNLVSLMPFLEFARGCGQIRHVEKGWDIGSSGRRQWNNWIVIYHFEDGLVIWVNVCSLNCSAIIRVLFMNTEWVELSPKILPNRTLSQCSSGQHQLLRWQIDQWRCSLGTHVAKIRLYLPLCRLLGLASVFTDTHLCWTSQNRCCPCMWTPGMQTAYSKFFIFEIIWGRLYSLLPFLRWLCPATLCFVRRNRVLVGVLQVDGLPTKWHGYRAP